MRKALVMILVLALAISQTACSNTAKEVGDQSEVVMPKPKGGDAALTILLNPAEYQNLTANDFFKDYVERFQKDFGVEVKYERLGSSPGKLVELEDRDNYLKELSTKLYADNGPELIFSQYMPIEPLIKQGATAKLNGKIPNLNKIYEGLLDEEIYFVPFSIQQMPKIINLEALKTTGMEKPAMDWMTHDRFEIRTKWLKANRIYFNAYEWFVTFQSIVDLDKAYDSNNNKMLLNTPAIKKGIADTREYIFGGNYILNKNYKFENYYRMIFEEDSLESGESKSLFIKNKEAGHIESGRLENLLRSIDVDSTNYRFGIVLMPEFSDKETVLNACGFAVNKNSKSSELAYEFISGMLSNEMQMELYNNDLSGYYPVNKELEDDIKALDADKVKDESVLETKEYLLNQIKNKRVKLWNTTNSDLLYLKQMIEEDLAKIILADEEYSDAEVSAKLSEMENKYSIYLNE